MKYALAALLLFGFALLIWALSLVRARFLAKYEEGMRSPAQAERERRRALGIDDHGDIGPALGHWRAP
jgi:hypothetical protein